MMACPAEETLQRADTMLLLTFELGNIFLQVLAVAGIVATALAVDLDATTNLINPPATKSRRNSIMKTSSLLFILTCAGTDAFCGLPINCQIQRDAQGVTLVNSSGVTRVEIWGGTASFA